MFKNIVGDIICKTFENEVGRFQKKNEKKYAMKVSFQLSRNFEKEDGYRYLDILIYGPSNYVGVLVRERWNVIPVEAFSDDEEGLKDGYDYIEGETEWSYASYHDSCWRSDGVSSVLNSNDEEINTLCGRYLNQWYEKVEMTEELQKIFEERISNGPQYKKGEGVFKF